MRRAIMIFGCVFLILYFGSFLLNLTHLDLRKLNAELSIQSWADLIISQGGGGRNCFSVGTSRVKNLRSIKIPKKDLDANGEIQPIPGSCLQEAKLIRMSYDARFEIVSSIYRCEQDDLIEELHLAIYLTGKPYDDWCTIGEFRKSWDVPIGESTMYSLP